MIMHTAVDASSGVVVTGTRELVSDGGESTSRYHCLNCGEPLEYNPAATQRCEQFQHPDSECFADGNMSADHRLCQELVAAQVTNHLPVPVDLEFESQITTGKSVLTPDIRVSPGRLVIEVVHTNQVSKDRLRRLLRAGYGVMVVVVVTGPVTPSSLERRLNSVAPITVGRFRPPATLSLGSVVTPRETAESTEA
jgi:hypothetical protein